MERKIKKILDLIQNGKLSPLDGKKLIEKMSQSRADETLQPDQMETDNVKGYEKYKSVVIQKPGPISSIQTHAINPKDPGKNEVQILVHAFSLNFGDLLCVKGLYPTMPEYPFSPGFEVSGVVTKTGSEVSRIKVGDEVIALTGPQLGGQSFVLNTHEALVVKKPKNLNHQEACSLPIVYLTMHHVFKKADVKRGEKILIQTATGGTGLIAVQRALQQGAEIFATAGSQEKIEYLKQLGVHHCINYRKEDFEQKVLSLTEGEGVDVVINTLSGESIQKGLNILKPNGRYLEIAMTGLKTAKQIDLSCLDNNQIFYSIDMRKMMLSNIESVTQYLDEMYEVLEKGMIKPTVGKVFSFSDIHQAYKYLDQRENIGKVVVTTPSTLWSDKDLVQGEKQKTTYDAKATETPNRKDVAIIGLSCQFPGAKNKEQFWSNLSQGVSSIREVPKNRWDPDKYYDSDPKKLDKTNCKWGGFLDDIDLFDALFFKISGKEAELSDPQQRLLLEESWNALEDAGYANDQISNKSCSVFVGLSNGDYVEKMNEMGVEKEAQSFWGNHNSVSAARISYFLNLKGPSIAIDTACSSSLVSIHLACQSIISGESEMALAGGAFINVTPQFHIASSNAEMLSPRGRSAAFDNDADGFVPGEGVAMLVLKSLDDAERDGDHIYGVIKGSGINQDGTTNGIIAPSSLSQTELEQSVYEKANINPEKITYVETHGTGTKLGDPIEIEALTNAFRKSTAKTQYCAIGSVKSNIGHAATAAGVASVIKVLLSMKNKQIPPSLNFDKPNEHIDFENSPFFVNTELKDWKVKNGEKRPAAVSSFGFSGTNAHLVIEEPPTRASIPQENPLYLIPFSARNEEGLFQQIANLEKWLLEEDEKSIADISYTLMVGRKHFGVRGGLIVRNVDELRQKLDEILEHGGVANYYQVNNRTSSQKYDQAKEDRGKHILNVTLQLVGLSESKYKEKLSFLLDLYIHGYDLDWGKIYRDTRHYRLSMPTYPFQKKRFWLPSNSVPKARTVIQHVDGGIKQIHPLIEQNTSDLNRIKFTTRMYGNEFFLKDHVIGDESVLPGVAYIEMGRAAGQIAGKAKVAKMKNLVWIHPFKINNTFKDIHIKLEPRQQEVHYEVFCESNKEELLHHGKIIFEHHEQQETQPTFLDLEEVMSRCKHLSTSNVFYKAVTKTKIFLGPSFQSIQELYGNERETLSRIKLPEVVQEENHGFQLHPSIMDGAFQTALAGTQSENLYVPFSLGEIEILHSLSNVSSVYSVRTGQHEQSMTFDVDLLDDRGQVLVRVRNLTARRYVFDEKNSQPQPHPLYFRKVWEPAPLSFEKNTLLGNLLIFDDKEEVWQAVKSHPSLSQAILVRPGVAFREVENNVYVISPNKYSDYVQLLSVLKQKGITPTQILFLWAHRETADTSDDVYKQLSYGIYAIFYLSQAFNKLWTSHPLELLYVYQLTNGLFGQSLHKAFEAFAKSISLEQKKYLYRSLAMESITPETVLATALPELQSASKQLDVRYMKGQRLVKQMREFALNTVEDGNSPWRKHGVYLITGGLGGIGFIFAKYLAKEYKANLLLTGRSPLTEKDKLKIEEIRTFGSEVTYYQSDVSNRQQVEQLMVDIKEERDSIHGILHCAGVLKDDKLTNKTSDQIEQVLAPKIFGTVWLDKLTKQENLDLFVLFSSTASVTGNIGQSDYAYGNSFMDHFSDHREQLRKAGQRNGKTLSINWPLWKEGGMKVEQQIETMMTKTLGMEPLETKTGIQTVVAGIGQQNNHFAVFVGKREKMKALIGDINETKQADETVSTKGDTNFELDTDSLRQYFEDDVLEIVANLLRIDKEHIFLDENFSEFGFDSLTLTDLSNQLNDRFQLELMPSIFFEHQTLSSVVDFILEHHNDSVLEMYQEKIDKPTLSIDSGQNISEAPDSLLANQDDGDWLPEEVNPEKSQRKRYSLTNEPVAIIGMSGKMPQSHDLDAFWKHIEEGKDLITEIPEDRWDWKEIYGDPATQSNKTNIKWGGFMKDVDKFDSLFFGISPKEAELMDPQQRILMETVWKTIEDAGYKASDLSGTKTGVFVGVASTDYGYLQENSEIQAQTSTGMSHSILTNRISYYLNLHGPSEPIDTACSSSLVAIHRAVEQIQSGQCDLAIAGGINVMISPKLYISFNKAGMLCEDGKCKTFDKDANGYVRGEGVATLLLKPLSKAEDDGDHIYGVIKGSAVNHGGRANSLTAPNPNAQSDLIVQAWGESNLDPSTVSYIEAHGTGTPLGDPVEINGLKKAFDQLYKDWGKKMPEKPYCGLGSVKTNIGHLETAAGIAGVCKVLLAMKNNVLPASINFNHLNPYIKFDDSPFYITAQKANWERMKDEYQQPIPRRAGISSFGFGGVNAHVVIEEYRPKSSRHLNGDNEGQIIILSAQNEDCLKEYAANLANKLSESDNLKEIAYTLQIGREEMDVRLALVVDSIAELKERLNRFCTERESVDQLNYGIVTAQQTKHLSASKEIKQDEFLRLMKEKQYDKLAKLWIAGEKIDWKQLHEGHQLYRVSLPTYPFERKRHWLPTPVSVNSQNKNYPNDIASLHPLIDRNESTISAIKFVKHLRGSEFVVSDHGLNQQKVLPGVATLEMALFTGNKALENKIDKITNIVWLHPVTVSENQIQDIFVYIGKNDKCEFEICMKGEEGQEILHSQGELHIKTDSSVPATEWIDLEDIKQRLSYSMTREQCYEAFKEVGLTYGPSFQGIQKLSYNESESLALIELRDELRSNFGKFVLHPSLMDAAVQSVIGILGLAQTQAMSVPYALEEVQIISEPTQKCYAYVKYASEQSTKNHHTFDIWILDQNGQLLVKLINLSVRSYQQEIIATTQGQRGNVDKHVVIKELLKQLELGQIDADEANKIMEEISYE